MQTPLLHSRRQATILLVDAQEFDLMLAEETLRQGGFVGNLLVARDGVQALDVLYQRTSYSKVPRPNLIVLNFDLPRKDGRDVLQRIKNDPTLRTIPVIILTESRNNEDIQKAYNLQANCCLCKPIETGMFVEMIQRLQLFWCETAALPIK